MKNLRELFHSNLSYLDNVAPVCIISSKLRVGINTPFFSCRQENLDLPVGVRILTPTLWARMKNT